LTGIFQDPPDLFSDDGTLTPDPMREDGTDESPLQGMNNRNRTSSGIPTDKLKKIRINRKDFKKGGDGLRGKNVTDQYRVKDKDLKRTMKWRTPEMMLKTLHNPGKPPPSGTSDSHPRKKHERPRKANQSQCTFDNESSDDILDMEEDEEDVYRKISERRSELNRARRNGDDCHVSWYPASALSPDKENEIMLLNQDELVAVCNGKSSSIERARVIRSSRLWDQFEIFEIRFKKPDLSLHEWMMS
jgi:hypothetical protein